MFESIKEYVEKSKLEKKMEEVADSFTKTYTYFNTKVDLISIANQLGYVVDRVKFPESEKSKAAVSIDRGDTYMRICVNEALSDRESNYYLAQTLSVIILDSYFLEVEVPFKEGVPIKLSTFQRTGCKNEYLVDYLSRCLLMPKKPFMKRVRLVNWGLSPFSIADHFGVDVENVFARIEDCKNQTWLKKLVGVVF